MDLAHLADENLSFGVECPSKQEQNPASVADSTGDVRRAVSLQLAEERDEREKQPFGDLRCW